MLLFIDFCELWWLAWLLPFLLGLGLGWLLWSKFKSLWSDSEAKVSSLTSSNARLEADLTSMRNAKADLEGDVALMKGRVREMETEVDGYKSRLSATGGAAVAGAGAGNAKLQDEIASLKAKLKECQSNSAALKAKADQAAADLAAAKANYSGNDIVSDSGANIVSDSGTDGVTDGVSSLAASGAASLAGAGDSTAAAGSLSGGTGAKSPYAKLKSDNLQIIEGVGPKMESVLHENGVKTWNDLAGKSEENLRAILDKYGDKYRIIDPASWSAQASKAGAGDWQGLISLQKSLDGGRGDTANNETDSKLEKLMMKMGLLKRYKQDDLKAIEGVGPKIEGLLQAGGINTWRELANTDVARIQDILDAAGSRYKLADPGTWPKQAELAADGKWEELQEYQDFLQGGK